MEDCLYHSFKSTWGTTEVVLRCSLKTYSKGEICSLMPRVEIWAFTWQLVACPAFVGKR